MPNIKGAAKRMRQAEKARLRNRAVRKQLKDLRKALLEMPRTGAAEAAEQYRRYVSALDKAVKKGVIKRNNANRRKSRMARWMKAVSAGPAASAPAAPEPASPSA